MKIILSPAVLLFVQLCRKSDAFLQPSFRKSCCLASTRFTPIAATREPSDQDDERYEQRGRAEEELKRVKYPGKQDGGSDIAYYDSYDDDEIVVEDEYLEDEENDGAVIVPETGNFWSNPREGMDRDLEVPRRRRQRMPPSTAAPRRRQPRGRGSRTTFRSGTPPAPEAFKDMYDKLFWYGVDEDEDNDRVPASYDKTVFGEKRGKFNALSYLEDDYDVRPPPRRIKRKLTQEEGDVDYDDYSNDDYYDADEDVVMRRDPPRRPRRREAGFDSEDGTPRRQRRGRRDDWVSEDVSEWFGEDDDDDEYDYDDEPVDSYDDDGYEEDSPRSRRQQRRRRSRTNPIVKFLDGLLDVDREDMSFKEQMYEQKLGRGPKPRTTEPRRRPSYVYDEIDDNFSDAIDLEDEKDGEVASEMLDNDDIMDAEIEEEPEEDAEAEKPRMSWEERSRRLELVPPAGIPAWGPSGDLGIDARTKAMLNGMEELRDARAQVEAKEERTKLARDDIVVLRADAALETKKRNSNPRRARERLRQIQLDIEDAARALRRAQKEEELAKARLDMLKDKHWAVLSLYDPNKASQEVAETIAEFSRQEVAADIMDGPGNDSNGPSQQQTDTLRGEDS